MANNEPQQQPSNRPSGNQSRNPFSGSSNAQRIIFWVLIVALFGYWIISSSDTTMFGGAPTIDYSKFRQEVRSGNVQQVVMKGERITGQLHQASTFKTGDGQSGKYSEFITYMPSTGDEELLKLLEDNNVNVKAIPKGDFSWWTVLIWVVPLLFLVFIGMQFYRQMRSQGQTFMNIGRSRAKLQDAKKVNTTFDDVAGLKGAKTELREIIGFLKHPGKFQSLGGEVPKGVLLVGPPGTGKTLLARAVAGEAGVPFFTITGSDFMEMFVGVGAKRVRDMFDKAKKKAPSIIFIDELDSIGRKRGAGLGGGHDEREQTLNQMLSELDGFEPNDQVIVMAATNRPDILDKALLRPGRFDRQITVHLPTQGHREEILHIHARNKTMGDDIDLHEIARSTPGFSGADLRNLLNEAALLAARKKQDAIHQADIDEARDKVMMGLKRESMHLSDEEKELLAYHEGGHAVVAAAMEHADPLHKVTVIPRGQAMGVTMQLPEKEKLLYQKKYMLDRLAVMMGGRAAEHLIFDTSTSGAENDLKQTTKLARKMVLDWGMSEKFGHMAFGSQREQVFLGEELGGRREFSDSTAREVDEEVKKILEQAFDRAINALKKHRNVLDKVAEELLEKEEISGKWVEQLIYGEEGKPSNSNGKSKKKEKEEKQDVKKSEDLSDKSKQDGQQTEEE